MNHPSKFHWASGVLLAMTINLAATPAAHAQQEQDKMIDAGLSMADNLSALTGKSVTLYLSNGNSVSGKVGKVYGGNIHIAELSGKEYFDALIRVDAVIGFEVRAKSG